ncbi:NTP transferase domain-containing protein [Odoribacter lunatus]|uniref:phosphocholine cytidylyltransferase family protein n=1 Tax=Odoribacter lunatus TaxID=2941335 RepID=UPI00203EAD9A|nr:phosphocholine cytidylyltransferase family protein [Odoribacter lunatus]
MKAIILAAGIASRLRPLTDHTPKCLLKIGKKCLLERTINNLLANHFNELVIVTGYLQEQIVEFVHTHYPALNVEFIYNEKYASTNNIYSLWLAGKSVSKEDLLLLDSDIIFDPTLVSAVLASSYPNCLAINRHPLGEEEMKVIADSQGMVQQISKTCPVSEAIGESIGIEKMSKEYVRHLFAELDKLILKEKQVNVFYEVAFERLIAQNQTFCIVDTTSYFSMELDTVEDFNQAIQHLPHNLL